MLRERREALGLTRDELGRRVGVTPAYIFLVEGARPRASGTPSRPKREVLRRWTEALGLQGGAAARILELAGYEPHDVDTISPPPYAPRSAAAVMMASAPLREITSPSPTERPATPLSRGNTEVERAALMSQLERILELAAQSPPLWEETSGMLRTVLGYVAGHLNRDQDDER